MYASKVAYTGQVTFDKVTETHGQVYLVTLYFPVISSQESGALIGKEAGKSVYEGQSRGGLRVTGLGENGGGHILDGQGGGA